MPTSLKQIEAQALTLSMTDRAKLAKFLLDSLRRPSPDRRRAWAEKIHKHMAAVERGEPSAYPDEDVFADVRRRSR